MSSSRMAVAEREDEIKVYTKANVPIVGTYKQYSAKNTNAGMDWSFVQLSPDFTLYYAKQDLVGFILNERAICARLPWEIRGSYAVQHNIEDHMMKVIASKYDIVLEDQWEVDKCKEAWLIKQVGYRSLDSTRLPYVLKEAVENGALDTAIVDTIKRADDEQLQDRLPDRNHRQRAKLP